MCDIRVDNSESSGGSSGNPAALASFTATCGVSDTYNGGLSGCSWFTALKNLSREFILGSFKQVIFGEI